MPVVAKELTRLKAHRWQISCLEFDHDGYRLASGGWDKEVHIWDLGSLKVLHTLKGTRAPVTCLGWYRPNSGILCTGSTDQTASLWNSETGKCVAKLKEHFGWVLGSCFSSSGSLLATASWDKTVRIWDAGTASLINNLSGHTDGVWSVDFHPQSSTLCSSGQDGSVIIWDARTNRPVRNLSYGHTDAVYSAKWSPDGAVIASGSADTKICIWEPSKESVINTIYGHTDTVKSVTFNPNSDNNTTLPILASAGDFSMRLSDPRPTQKADILSCSLHTPGKEVEAVSISPDGSVVVTGGRDGLLILMSLSIPSVMPQSEPERAQATSAATVVRQPSSEILEESLKHLRTSSPANEELSNYEIEELSKNEPVEEEDIRVASEVRDVLMDMCKEPRRRSQHIQNKPVFNTGMVTYRRDRESREKRMSGKVVDIPTMVAHLSARASMIEEPSSSSGSESDDDSDVESRERVFQVNASEEAGRFLENKDTVSDIMESTQHSHSPAQLEYKNLSKEKETKKKDTSIFEEDDMDNVVLLMKNFLDENKPLEVATEHSGEYRLSSIVHSLDSLLQSDNQGSLDEDDEKRNTLNRAGSASGNEYGDEVPLSMI